MPVNGVILAGGFAIGIVVGGLLLFRGSEPAQTSMPAKFAARQTSSTGHEEPAATNVVDSEDLAMERQRLQAELATLKLQQEVDALKRELTARKTSAVSTEALARKPASQGRRWSVKETRIGSSEEKQPAGSAAKTNGKATLAYWNRINDVIEQEGAMRASPLGGVTASNAGRFFEARIRAGEFAVDALRSLDTTSVDPQAAAVAETVAQWYDAGRGVAETGRDLLGRGSSDQRQGTAGQRYQAAEKEHSQRVNAVNAEGERVRQQLANKYGLTFPPLK